MGKSVYSLVLADEIVFAVDALAVQQGLNRSSLVNRILAEYASLPTPEERAGEMLDTVRNSVKRQGMRSHAQTGISLTLRTSLGYKYNPALSYTLDLREQADGFGRLRVALRSQNEAVLAYFGLFFDLWEELEKKYLLRPLQPRQSEKQQKKYQRLLRSPAGMLQPREQGLALAEYIMMMDDCMRVFFGNLGDAKTAIRKTEEQYLKRKKKTDQWDEL